MISLLLAVSLQTTWVVDVNGTAPGTGTAADPYTSVTFALAQPSTSSGDTVLVRPGTYPDEAVDFLGKTILLRSTDGSATTRIESVPFGPSPAPAVSLISGEVDAVIEGFTIVGDGGAPGVWPVLPLEGVGGGLLCLDSSVTLEDVVVSGGEQTAAGAGVFARNASLTLNATELQSCGDPDRTIFGGGLYAESCTIDWQNSEVIDNSATFRGAGVYLLECASELSRMTFRSNGGSFGAGQGITVEGGSLTVNGTRLSGHFSGDAGGAMLITGDAAVDLRSCDFSGNSASFPDPYAGGAIRLDSGSLRAVDTLFSGNRGQFGGAISAAAPIELERCTFIDNRASGAGQFGSHGGALAVPSGTRISRCTFVNNVAQDTFSDGGGALFGAAEIEHCTFVHNQANASDPGAIAGTGSTLTNCIVRGARGSVGSATVTYSNVEGGSPGTGNFDGDPGFWDEALDLRLLPGSLCIDTGDPASASDPDGTRADVGAFPFDPLVGDMLGSTTCLANPNSTGVGAELIARGLLGAGADRVTLHVTDSPAGSLGYFLTSQTAGSSMLGGGSQGRLCLGGNVLRFSASVLDDRGTDTVSFHPRLGAFPQGTVAMAGESWLFQYWFRDANPVATSNTSSTVSLILE